MQTLPKTFGPFRIVEPSQLRGVALTQDQRLSQAKQRARARSWADLHEERADKAASRRFTGEAISNFGAFA